MLNILVVGFHHKKGSIVSKNFMFSVVIKIDLRRLISVFIMNGNESILKCFPPLKPISKTKIRAGNTKNLELVENVAIYRFYLL